LFKQIADLTLEIDPDYEPTDKKRKSSCKQSPLEIDPDYEPTDKKRKLSCKQSPQAVSPAPQKETPPKTQRTSTARSFDEKDSKYKVRQH
jgi:hypothetical protein